MNDVIFEIFQMRPEMCEVMTCPRKAVHEIRIIGSTGPTRVVCGRHTTWAKTRLMEHEMSRPPAAPARTPATEE